MYAKVGSGIDFELAWMDKLLQQNPDMLVVDCSQGVELIPMSEEGEGAMDPHIWMSPRNAETMVRNICEGLERIDPDSAEYYRRNRDAYLEELEAVDREIRAQLEGAEGRAFMVYHPSLGYFAHEYGLVMIPIEEEGKEPTAAGLARLIDEAKRRNIKVILSSPQFDPRKAETIAREIGGRVVLVDPLARDYVENLRRLLGEIISALG